MLKSYFSSETVNSLISLSVQRLFGLLEKKSKLHFSPEIFFFMKHPHFSHLEYVFGQDFNKREQNKSSENTYLNLQLLCQKAERL